MRLCGSASFCLFQVLDVDSMAGNKKGKKAATLSSAPTASSTATAATAGGHNASGLCSAVVSLINQILQGRGSGWLHSALFKGLWEKVQLLLDLLDAESEYGERALGREVQKMALEVSPALLQLVSKLLSARKRPRDWKQDEYCAALGWALLAASTILQLPVKHTGNTVGNLRLVHLPTAFGRVLRADLLTQTAAAQEEVCQLLQAALKQQQQQQQDQQQQQQDQQQQQQDQQQQQQQQAVQVATQQRLDMWQVSVVLLEFWQVIDWAWSLVQATGLHSLSTSQHAETLAKQKPALELAAVLTQNLTANSSKYECDVLLNLYTKWALTLSLRLDSEPAVYTSSQHSDSMPKCKDGMCLQLDHPRFKDTVRLRDSMTYE
jgi:hypothetical protein